MERRDPGRYRVQLTVALTGLQALASVLHLSAALVYPAARSATTTRVVAYISGLGPYWVVAFGVTAAGMAVCAVLRKALHVAHLVAAFVWVVYASSLWFGAYAAQPHGTVLYPSLATVVAVVNTIVAAGYNDQYGLEARR